MAPQTSSLGPAPGGFGYGTEWNSAQLNGSPPAPGLGGPGDTNGHGSHTMGIAPRARKLCEKRKGPRDRSRGPRSVGPGVD